MADGPPLPRNEMDRLAALARYQVLDTPPEPAFDEIAALAAAIAGTPIAFVGLIDGERQWFKATYGFDAPSVPRATAICAHYLESADVVVVTDASEDDRFRDLPVVRGDPRVRFYAGAPLRTADGFNLGTLCCLDRIPRALAPEKLEALAILSRQVVAQLELRRALLQVQEAQRERLNLEVQRDELVGFVVHDMKNPIAALMGWAELLLADPKTAKGRARDTLFRMERAAGTLNRMVLDLLDIRHSEKGGLPLNPSRVPLKPLVEDAVETVRSRMQERKVKLVLSPELAGKAVRVDPEVMRRVLENVLENSVKYGLQEGTIRIGCHAAPEGRVELTIADDGPGIPEADRERIFEKYVRLERGPGQRRHGSHGLGLVFCKLAVEASGGRIRVTGNEPHGAVFHLELPLDA